VVPPEPEPAPPVPMLAVPEAGPEPPLTAPEPPLATPEPKPEPPLAVPPSLPDELHAKGNRTVTALSAAVFGSNRHSMTVSEWIGSQRHPHTGR
jgi:hypothetical protein